MNGFTIWGGEKGSPAYYYTGRQVESAKAEETRNRRIVGIVSNLGGS